MLSTRALLSRRRQVVAPSAVLSPLAVLTAARSFATSRLLLDDSKPPQQATGSYDRDADLKREAEARQRMFTQGMPNPFKMTQQAAQQGGANPFFQFNQQQQQQGGSDQQQQQQQQQQQATGATPGSAPTGMTQPKNMREAMDMAWKQSAQQFFGTDRPPGNWQEIQQAAAARRSGQKWTPPEAATGDSTSSTTTTTSDSPQSTTASSSSTTSTGSGGQAPPNFGMPPFGAGAGSSSNNGQQAPKPMRFLAGLIIVYCSFWMMSRQGFFGNFNHIQVPFWVVGPEATGKWLLFVALLDEARRIEIQKSFEAQRVAYPTMSFFDFVDSVQPDWCSTPNYSKYDVSNALSSLMQRESPWRAVAIIRGGLESNSGMMASMFGSSDANSANLSDNQKKIEALMKVLPAMATGGFPGGAMMSSMMPFGGAGGQQQQQGMASPMMLARVTNPDGSSQTGWNMMSSSTPAQMPQGQGAGQHLIPQQPMEAIMSPYSTTRQTYVGQPPTGPGGMYGQQQQQQQPSSYGSYNGGIVGNPAAQAQQFAMSGGGYQQQQPPQHRFASSSASSAPPQQQQQHQQIGHGTLPFGMTPEQAAQQQQQAQQQPPAAPETPSPPAVEQQAAEDPFAAPPASDVPPPAPAGGSDAPKA